jgi:uncharacterized OB-fold protein
MSTASYDKPVPEPTLDSQPYWDTLKEHRLMLQQCARCGTIRHYPRPLCARCYSMQVKWIEASGQGTVYSWIVAHHPFHPGFKAEVPYVLATVELQEGVRMVGPLRGVAADAIRIGMPVEVVFEDVTAGLTLPAFRPQQ